MPKPRHETPDLIAERAAAFAEQCRSLRASSGVESRYEKIDLSNLESWLPEKYKSLARIMLESLDYPKTMAIGGERGTGKTGIACGLVNAFCNLGRRARYRRVADLFGELESVAWEKKEEVRQANCLPDLLVIDEVQVRDAGKQWQDNELTTLVDRRYARQKSTILLSNLKPEQLRENVGISIWRRIVEEGGVYETDWPRLMALKEAQRQTRNAGGSNA